MMQKLIGILIVLLTSSLASAQQFTLNDVSLSWKDFTKKPGFRNHPYDAKIYTQIDYRYKVKENREGIVVKTTVRQYVDKEKSWVKEAFLQKYSKEIHTLLLNHEKGHQLISLIHFKQLEEQLKSYPFSKNFKKELDSIYKAAIASNKLMDELYDAETNHMKLTDKQKEWEQKLLQQLNKLYANERRISTEFEVESRIKRP